MSKNLYIIAGCNGAGKTTASLTILPEILGCKEFVNADNIAKGLSPFQPEKVAVEAGRIMLNRVDELMKKGYQVTLLFFWLKNPEMAKARVAARVKEGGHDIPQDVIERRHIGGIKALFDIYLPIVDVALLFDNSEGNHKMVAKKKENLEIVDIDRFNQIQAYYEKR